MVDINEVEEEIINLEKRDTSFATCERLAWLYIVRDHLKGYAQSAAAPHIESESTPELGDSEFLRAASNVDLPSLMQILNEHMEALKLVYPSAYKDVMGRIAKL